MSNKITSRERGRGPHTHGDRAEAFLQRQLFIGSNVTFNICLLTYKCLNIVNRGREEGTFIRRNVFVPFYVTDTAPATPRSNA